MWWSWIGVAAAAPPPCPSWTVPADPVGPGVDATCADLRGADLRGADLRGAQLYGARLDGADLSGADLRGAALVFATLEGADLEGADLSDADVRQAVLRFADLHDAVLDRTDLCHVDLTVSRGVRWTRSSDGTVFCGSTLLVPEWEHPERDGWKFRPFQRVKRRDLVAFRAVDGLGVYVYGDPPIVDDDDTFDLYTRGETAVAVSVASFDLVPPVTNWTHRHTMSAVGVTLGTGFGTNDNDTVVTSNLGVFAEPLSFLVLEGGIQYGVAVTRLGDNGGFPDDFAPYFGVRLAVTPLVEVFDDLARVAFR